MTRFVVFVEYTDQHIHDEDTIMVDAESWQEAQVTVERDFPYLEVVDVEEQ